MRACEGCRRRKIKCDAATTNAWPCSACTRLKLHCVPPSLNYDAESFHSSTTYEPEQPQSYGILDGGGTGQYQQKRSPRTQLFPGSRTSGQEAGNQVSFQNGTGSYGTSSFATQPNGQHGPIPPPSYPTAHDQVADVNDLSYHPNILFSSPPGRPSAANASPESWQSDPYSSENLSDALGELKIDECGVGMTFFPLLKCVFVGDMSPRLIIFVSTIYLPTEKELG